MKKITVCSAIFVLVFATMAPAMWRMDRMISGGSKFPSGEVAACLDAGENADHEQLNMQGCDHRSGSMPHMDHQRAVAGASPFYLHPSDLPSQELSFQMHCDQLIRIPARPSVVRAFKKVGVLRSLAHTASSASARSNNTPIIGVLWSEMCMGNALKIHMGVPRDEIRSE